MTPQEKARQLRPFIVKSAASLDDKDASCAAELFPRMKYDGALIEYKTRINWNGKIKIAVQDLWDTEQNNPDNAPNLWGDIEYRDGIRIIPQVITAEKAFAKGEKGWWKEEICASKIDANVWTPDQYPQGWEVATA